MIIQEPTFRKKSLKPSKMVSSLHKLNLESGNESGIYINTIDPEILTQNNNNAPLALSLKQMRAIKNKQIKKYVDLFTHKIKRNVTLSQSYQKQQKKRCADIFRTQIEGMQLPDYVVRAIVIISILKNLIWMVFSTFQGFIDDFSQNYSYRAEVVIIKILCLSFSLLYFAVKCVSRFGHGQLSIYIHQIFWAYTQSNRIFVDLTSIIFQILSLAFPQVMTISGIFFFILVIAFIFSLNDVISIQTTFFHKEKNLLLWGIAKIAISNVIFGHLMASIILTVGNLIAQLLQQTREANRKKAVFRRMIRSEDRVQTYISKRLQIKILRYLRECNNGHQDLHYLQRDQIIKSLQDDYMKIKQKIQQTFQIFESNKQESLNQNQMYKQQNCGEQQNYPIGSYTEERFKSLIEQALKKHENKWQQQFWILDIDKAYNFNYYFSEFNPSKVHKLKLK